MKRTYLFLLLLCLTFFFTQANSIIDSTDVLVCSYTTGNTTISEVVYESIPEEAVETTISSCLDITEASFPLEIIPSKDEDDINGVSTFDLVLIMKHILGSQLLDSPYKMIAADLNGNGAISVSDVIILRQLILGVTVELPNSDSWVFINSNYEFEDPTNPFPELSTATEMILESLPNEPASFIGIKMGDVNDSAAPN